MTKRFMIIATCLFMAWLAFMFVSTTSAEMQYRKLKTKGLVTMAKEEGKVKVTVTRYNAFGESSQVEQEIDVAWLTAHRANKIEEIALLQAEIEEIDALLVDVGKLE